ncbi:hypothetical protein K461DRAFT_265493 [Myriangium duriaei CBS 260.36]|uniref:BTB domain-containing protein n=1 Tax=Myriangium duriaei CBS 260.36 TaxID=1168546 RepID=A0A9P4MK92_9PEZI|nr:hypothetical protein K461DRAFT_265493 [Myriangium duriaei CBS 260.36]
MQKLESTSELFGPAIIYILVGSTSQLFTVHKDLFLRSSSYAEASLSPLWHDQLPLAAANQCLPTGTPFLDLREQDVAHFPIYVNFLYTGNILWNMADGWELIFGAFCLGEYLQDECFRNAIINRLNEVVKENANNGGGWFDERLLPSANYVYKHTLPKSVLRTWLVDMHVQAGKGRCAMNPAPDGSDPPFEFIRDVLDSLTHNTDISSGWKPWAMDLCDYHDHDSHFSYNACCYHVHDRKVPWLLIKPEATEPADLFESTAELGS